MILREILSETTEEITNDECQENSSLSVEAAEFVPCPCSDSTVGSYVQYSGDELARPQCLPMLCSSDITGCTGQTLVKLPGYMTNCYPFVMPCIDDKNGVRMGTSPKQTFGNVGSFDVPKDISEHPFAAYAYPSHMTDSGQSRLIAPWLMSTGCLPFMAPSRAPFFRAIPGFCAPIVLKNLLPGDTSRPPPHFAGRRFPEVNRGKGGLLPTPLHLPGHPISVHSAAASACDGVGTSSEGYPNRCGDGQPCIKAPPGQPAVSSRGHGSRNRGSQGHASCRDVRHRTTHNKCALTDFSTDSSRQCELQRTHSPFHNCYSWYGCFPRASADNYNAVCDNAYNSSSQSRRFGSSATQRSHVSSLANRGKPEGCTRCGMSRAASAGVEVPTFHVSSVLGVAWDVDRYTPQSHAAHLAQAEPCSSMASVTVELEARSYLAQKSSHKKAVSFGTGLRMCNDADTSIAFAQNARPHATGQTSLSVEFLCSASETGPRTVNSGAVETSTGVGCLPGVIGSREKPCSTQAFMVTHMSSSLHNKCSISHAGHPMLSSQDSPNCSNNSRKKMLTLESAVREAASSTCSVSVTPRRTATDATWGTFAPATQLPSYACSAWSECGSGNVTTREGLLNGMTIVSEVLYSGPQPPSHCNVSLLSSTPVSECRRSGTHAGQRGDAMRGAMSKGCGRARHRGKWTQSGGDMRLGGGGREPEHTVSGTDLSQTSDGILPIVDDGEIHDVATAISGRRSSGRTHLAEDSHMTFPILSYSETLKTKHDAYSSSDRLPSATGSCLSGEETGCEKSFQRHSGVDGSLDVRQLSLLKRARKRQKRQEQANRAADEELAEISLEQQILQRNVIGQCVRPACGSHSGRSTMACSRSNVFLSSGSVANRSVEKLGSPGYAERSQAPKQHEPIAFNIADMLDAFEAKRNHRQQKTLSGSSYPRSIMVPPDPGRGVIANSLDSCAPAKRGKERETPRAKRTSPLKKVILRERAERKRRRLIDNGDYGEVELSDSCSPCADSAAKGFASDHETRPTDAVYLESRLSQDDAVKSQPSDVELTATPSVGLSPISQTSPLSMSPLTPGASPVNSPIAGYLGHGDPVAIRIHSRRFREYCTQILDKGIDAACNEFLCCLARLQDRSLNRDRAKAKGKRRFVLGLREVTKHLRLKKIKCVIVSPNLEKIQSKGGLDEALNNILTMCHEQNVPFVFALGRRALGRACGKLVPVSVVGIFNYHSCEEEFCRLVSLTHKGREAYVDMVKEVEKEIAENTLAVLKVSVGSPLPCVYSHMCHSRTPSGCSAISFTSSVLSEPISENYPYSEPEVDRRRCADGVAKPSLVVGDSGQTGACVADVPCRSSDDMTFLHVADIDDGNEADTEDFGPESGKLQQAVSPIPEIPNQPEHRDVSPGFRRQVAEICSPVHLSDSEHQQPSNENTPEKGGDYDDEGVNLLNVDTQQAFSDGNSARVLSSAISSFCVDLAAELPSLDPDESVGTSTVAQRSNVAGAEMGNDHTLDNSDVHSIHSTCTLREAAGNTDRLSTSSLRQEGMLKRTGRVQKWVESLQEEAKLDLVISGNVLEST